jgi:putative transposase
MEKSLRVKRAGRLTPQSQRTSYKDATTNKTKTTKVIEALNTGRRAVSRERVFTRGERTAKKAPGLSSNQQKAEAIMELRHTYDVALLLRCVKLARSSFYYHAHPAEPSDKYTQIKARIQSIYQQHKGRFGYRRITLALRSEGFIINHKTVYRLMQSLQLKSLIRVKKYKSYKGQQGNIAPNLLNRDFTAGEPHQKWATDITEFKVSGEKLYLSPVIDLYNQEIISYELSERPDFKTVITMLNKALKTADSPAESLLLHSDQGWHYQMKQYQHVLLQHGITQSMSRKGNCLDNAIIENFFGIVKSELFYLNKYDSIAQLKQDIHDYIHYYNNDRIKLNLNGMSPIQYRAHHSKN